MKTLGLIIVLGVGVLMMLIALVPINMSVVVHGYPAEAVLTNGKLRVGDILIQNNGWFTKTVALPEITACVGDREVPIDSWTVSGDTIVRGAGQLKTITVRPGESGTIYLIASDAIIYENMVLYYREPYFSCLTPGKPIDAAE